MPTCVRNSTQTYFLPVSLTLLQIFVVVPIAQDLHTDLRNSDSGVRIGKKLTGIVESFQLH